MLKKIVTINLFIFWVLAAAVLAAGFVVYSNGNKNSQALPANITNAPGATGKGTGSNTVQLVLSAKEVAKHNNASSCWMIISGKVYDVTTAISSHPGGAGPILSSCGTDATQAFMTKDLSPGRNHSGTAYSMLSSYYIGDLNTTVSAPSSPGVTNPGSTNSTPLPTRGRENDD